MTKPIPGSASANPLLQPWATPHGLPPFSCFEPAHFQPAFQAAMQAHLDEFVFRWNRRRWRRASFDTLLGLSMRLPHAGFRDFVPGPG
jgi:hypothetical protein